MVNTLTSLIVHYCPQRIMRGEMQSQAVDWTMYASIESLGSRVSLWTDRQLEMHHFWGPTLLSPSH